MRRVKTFLPMVRVSGRSLSRFLFSLLLAIFPLYAFAQVPVRPCERFLITSAGIITQQIPREDTFQDTAEFDHAESIWMGDLVAKFRSWHGQRTSNVTMPESFQYSTGPIQRMRNTEAADKLKRAMFDAMPEIVESLAANSAQTQDLDSIFSRFKSIIERHYGNGSATTDLVDKKKKELEAQWSLLKSDSILESFRFDDSVGFVRQYLGAFEETMARFSVDAKKYFSETVRKGAAFGNIASQVVLSSLELRAASVRSVLALTLLHPLTDDALDQGWDVAPSMRKITSWLQGGMDRVENPYEEIVFRLISDIREDFPPAEHPVLHHVLSKLHEAQLQSVMIQKNRGNSEATDEDLFRVVTKKGAYTAVALSYMAIGTLTKSESEYFFRSGLQFQMGDDLMDVIEDRKDGTQTLWTRSLTSNSNYRRTMQLYSNFQNDLEELGSSLLDSHRSQRALLNNAKLGFRFYLFSSLLHEELDSYNKSALRNHLPLMPANIRRIVYSLFSQLQIQAQRTMAPSEAAAIEFYGQIMDQHFLGFSFLRFEDRRGNRNPRRMYWVNHPNPYFLLIKFGNRAQNLFASLRTDSETVLGREWNQFKTTMIAVGMLYLYLWTPQQIDAHNLKEIANIANLIGAFTFMLGGHDEDGSGRFSPSAFRSRIVWPFMALGLNSALRIIDFFK